MTEHLCARRCAGRSDRHRGAGGPGILPERPSTPTAAKEIYGAAIAKTFLQGLSGLSLLGFQISEMVNRYGKDRGQGTLVALMAAEPQGLAVLGSGGRASLPQAPCAFSLPTVPAQAKQVSNKGWRGRGRDRGPAGSRARAAPGRRSALCVMGEQRLCPCGLGGLGTPANPIYGEKVGPTPAIMEFTEPEKNNILKMQREKGKVEGEGIKSLGSLFVSVFKERNVDFSGKYLEHFKRNGKCLKRQAEQCPRQPSAWLGWVH